MDYKNTMTIMLIEKNADANRQILLGYKKRGLGASKWNGFGGKVEINENIVDAAIRETVEESGLTPIDPKRVGVIHWILNNEKELCEIHVFHTTKYSGVLTESDEMRPKWFCVNDIPFDQMWEDDKEWYPLILRKRCFYGWVISLQEGAIFDFTEGEFNSEFVMKMRNNFCKIQN